MGVREDEASVSLGWDTFNKLDWTTSVRRTPHPDNATYNDTHTNLTLIEGGGGGEIDWASEWVWKKKYVHVPIKESHSLFLNLEESKFIF